MVSTCEYFSVKVGGRMSDSFNIFADRLFAPLGRFIFNFEYLCHELRATGVRVFEIAGLKKLELAEVTFAGLTASPLLEVIASLLAQSANLSSEQTRQLCDIRKRVENLIVIRNRVIHSTWQLFDFADVEYGAPDGLLINKRRKRTGLETLTTVMNKQELERLCEETREVADLIKTFRLALTP
jgi:hypothetical protein